MTFPKIARGRSTAQQMEARKARVTAYLQAGHTPEQIAQREGISLQWALRNIERALASQDPAQGAEKPLGGKPSFDPAPRLAAAIEGWLGAVDRIAEILDRIEFFLRLRGQDAMSQPNLEPPSPLGLDMNEAIEEAKAI